MVFCGNCGTQIYGSGVGDDVDVVSLRPFALAWRSGC
jgi:hypothetical protein